MIGAATRAIAAAASSQGLTIQDVADRLLMQHEQHEGIFSICQDIPCPGCALCQPLLPAWVQRIGGGVGSRLGDIIVQTIRVPFFDKLCSASFLLPLMAAASACLQDVARSHLLESRVYLPPGPVGTRARLLGAK
jgi:hypothetical protein